MHWINTFLAKAPRNLGRHDADARDNSTSSPTANRITANPRLPTAIKAILLRRASTPVALVTAPRLCLPTTAATRPTPRSSRTITARVLHTTAQHRPRTSRATILVLVARRARRVSGRLCWAARLEDSPVTRWVVGSWEPPAVQFSALSARTWRLMNCKSDSELVLLVELS